MNKSSIEWCDITWNVVRGCTRVSPGCVNCYAERLSARNLPGLRSPTTGEPFAIMKAGGPRWTGEVEFLPHKLAEPLSWKKPARVFVNSMSDLFHEGLEFEHIAAALAIVGACPHLTFQVLTKRPERAVEFYRWVEARTPHDNPEAPWAKIWRGLLEHLPGGRTHAEAVYRRIEDGPGEWPLPNLHLGVSVENQETADERIPLLLQCPAAVRFVSYEPALGPVDFRQWLKLPFGLYDSAGDEIRRGCTENACRLYLHAYASNRSIDDSLANHGFRIEGPSRIDWIIVGGESGPGARPFDVEWARSAVRQCREAGVPVFVKQLGANRMEDGLTDPGHTASLDRVRDRKGGDPSEWPEDLRVREFPEAPHA